MYDVLKILSGLIGKRSFNYYTFDDLEQKEANEILDDNNEFYLIDETEPLDWHLAHH